MTAEPGNNAAHASPAPTNINNSYTKITVRTLRNIEANFPLPAGFTITPQREYGVKTRPDGVTIEFDPFELRAQEQHYLLPPVPLMVGERAGTTLKCTWDATARNVAGRDTGQIDVIIEPSNFDVSCALQDRED